MRLVVLLASLFLTASAVAQPPGPRAAPDFLPRAQEWCAAALHDLDLLRDALRQEVRNPQLQATLVRRADEVLGEVLTFQRTLQPGVPEGALVQRARDVERRLEGLTGDLARLPQHPGVAFAVRRLRFDENRLEQLTAAHRPPAPPTGPPAGSVVRHARLLESTLWELDDVLQAPGRDELRRLVAAMLERLEQFRDRAEAGAPYEALRKDYLGVDRTWDRLDLALYQAGLLGNAPVRTRWLRTQAQHETLADLLRLDALQVGNVLDRLQGTWGLVSINENGVPRDLSEFGKQYFIFKGNTWTLTEGGRVTSTAKFKIVDATGPVKAMDSFVTTGNDQGEVVQAIFTLRGNVLTYAPGRVRPTGFGQNYYTVWRKLSDR